MGTRLLPGNCSVRRETGKKQMLKVRHDEGVAICIGPEPCVGAREGVGEASVGERTGPPLVRQEADVVQPVKVRLG